jgi:hypothetical protein
LLYWSRADTGRTWAERMARKRRKEGALNLLLRSANWSLIRDHEKYEICRFIEWGGERREEDIRPLFHPAPAAKHIRGGQFPPGSTGDPHLSPFPLPEIKTRRSHVWTVSPCFRPTYGAHIPILRALPDFIYGGRRLSTSVIKGGET